VCTCAHISQDGCTTLYLAAQGGHVDVVDQLLEANADPELKICGKSTVKIEWTYCEVHLGNTLDLNHPLGMFTSNTQDNSGVNPEGAH